MENLAMSLEFIYPLTLAFLPYCVLGLLAMVEGPVVTLMGGAATSSGLLLPIPVYLAVVFGNLTADMGWYTLGRFSKLEWLTRFSQKVGVDPRRIEQLERGVQLHAPRLLFLSKMTVGFPIPTLVATGLSRVPVRRWVGMLILGELIKSAVLVFAGHFYAQTIQYASHDVQMVLWSATAVLLVAGVVWFKRHKKKSQ
jgi:membrane protein DedA with SNARE-associated domain